MSGDSRVLPGPDGTALVVVIWSDADLFTSGRPVMAPESEMIVAFRRPVASALRCAARVGADRAGGGHGGGA
jgi:hypothetical protein